MYPSKVNFFTASRVLGGYHSDRTTHLLCHFERNTLYICVRRKTKSHRRTTPPCAIQFSKILYFFTRPIIMYIDAPGIWTILPYYHYDLLSFRSEKLSEIADARAYLRKTNFWNHFFLFLCFRISRKPFNCIKTAPVVCHVSIRVHFSLYRMSPQFPARPEKNINFGIYSQTPCIFMHVVRQNAPDNAKIILSKVREMLKIAIQ